MSSPSLKQESVLGGPWGLHVAWLGGWLHAHPDLIAEVTGTGPHKSRSVQSQDHEALLRGWAPSAWSES